MTTTTMMRMRMSRTSFRALHVAAFATRSSAVPGSVGSWIILLGCGAHILSEWWSLRIVSGISNV